MREQRFSSFYRKCRSFKWLPIGRVGVNDLSFFNLLSISENLYTYTNLVVICIVKMPRDI